MDTNMEKPGGFRVTGRRCRLASVAVVLIFAMLGIGCAPDPTAQVYTGLHERIVTDNVFDTTPVRGELRPLRRRRGGYEFKCSECHTAITAPVHQQPNVMEHADIVFNHGLNTNCLNCHHPEDRNNYLGYDGGVIPADQPAQLCAKCHGPQFRDWEKGIHGRQNGHWDISKGEKTKLYCIQCHDPHDPHFPLMQPSRPPPYNRFATSGKESHHE